MSDEEQDAVPWEQREGWTDIRPIPQDDGPNALCQIAYHGDYRNAMDAFRYLVSVDEKSARGVELTEDIVRMNPSNYSVWSYRSECLIATKADLSKELDFMDELIQHALKSYQVWQHRRVIVLASGDSSRELAFTSKALSLDSKNYHTWAYRQWVLCHFFGTDSAPSKDTAASIWQGELTFVESMLADDVRNNSAWNHRFFVAFESGSEQAPQSIVTERELSFTQEKLALAPNNASGWNYLRGVLRHAQKPFSELLPWARALAERQPPVHLAVEFVADALAVSADDQEKREAVQLYDELSQKLDPIRSGYWKLRRQQVAV